MKNKETDFNTQPHIKTKASTEQKFLSIPSNAKSSLGRSAKFETLVFLGQFQQTSKITKSGIHN
jgi:hypothetical protein